MGGHGFLGIDLVPVSCFLFRITDHDIMLSFVGGDKALRMGMGVGIGMVHVGDGLWGLWLERVGEGLGISILGI